MDLCMGVCTDHGALYEIVKLSLETFLVFSLAKLLRTPTIDPRTECGVLYELWCSVMSPLGTFSVLISQRVSHNFCDF